MDGLGLRTLTNDNAGVLRKGNYEPVLEWDRVPFAVKISSKKKRQPRYNILWTKFREDTGIVARCRNGVIGLI